MPRDAARSTSLTVLSGEEILEAVAFDGEMTGVELEFPGGETEFGNPAFADQSPLANDAQADEPELTIPQGRLEGRSAFEGTARLPHHESAQKPGVLLLDDLESVRAAGRKAR